METYKLLIGGEWIAGENEISVRSPYDSSIVGKVSSADHNLLLKAIDVAESGFSQTRKLSSFARSEILNRVAEGLTQNSEMLARTIVSEAGKPIREARVEVSRAVNTFRIAAEECKRFGGEVIPLDLLATTEGRWGLTRRFPSGPILAISPFNFPLNLIAHKVAPAIAVGNSVIIKPSSATPITALKLAEVILEAGFPPPALSVTPCRGAVVETVLGHPKLKKLSFTGSPEVGWRLKALCGKMKITLELGGNAAAVIDDDTSLDLALKRCLTGAFSYAGQICISIQRIIIREDLYPPFIEKFILLAQELKMGDPHNENTDLGPMIDEASAAKAELWVNQALDKGAKLLLGGKRKGTMFPPTILANVPRTEPAYCAEIFAPVVVISKYKDFESALAEVNDSIYGLQAGIFTNDLKKALRAFEILEVGGVMIGDIPTFRIDNMPYGGVKNSGFGREGVKYAMEEMSELKLLTFNPLA